MTADEQLGRRRPPPFPAEVLNRPVPAAINRGRQIMRTAGQAVQQAEVDTIDVVLSIRDRIIEARQLLARGQHEPAEIVLSDLHDSLDSWLQRKRSDDV